MLVDVESSSIGGGESENVIVLHPEFRMIVLANRPGFPFLGNDFFGAMGVFLNRLLLMFLECYLLFFPSVS